MTTIGPIGLLVTVTLLWGLSSAALSTLEGALTSIALVPAGGSAMLLILAVVRGDDPRRIFAASPRFYLRLGGLEAANLVLFVAALRIGPLPMVVALHLTAPLLLIAARIVRRERKLTVLVVFEMFLVGAAIWLAAAWRPTAVEPEKIVLGCVLAVGSAVCVAMLVSLVARESAVRTTIASAGLQLLIASMLSSALMVTAPPRAAVVGWLLLIGATLLGPGFALYWYAMRRLDATTASIVGLNEAVIASIAGAIFTDKGITLGALAAGVLVLSAVAIEMWSRRESRVR
ncbi:DMT family transporter [Nocardia takedensis]|uniref:DMT family transporter n=1 Tax=Nocardia takedensis TaxID=259390 RepID=UPI0002D599EF|nr:DMT family transporter [Nocardia takedensis]